MDFRKIKFDGSKVTLTWAEETPSKRPGVKDTTEHTLTSFDTPAPEFISAMRALAPLACRIIEVPDYYGANPDLFKVQSASMPESGGAVVTCLCTVDAAPAPVVLNTPFLTDDPDSGYDVPSEFFSAIDALRKEAERFHKGERAQGDLFSEPAHRADDGGLLARAADLCPKPGSGIDSVTISTSNGKSVTLTQETGRKLRVLAGKERAARRQTPAER